MPATSHVSNRKCLVLHCHAAGSHIITDHRLVLLKWHLGNNHQFHIHKEVEIAVHEHANVTPDLYCEGFLKLCPDVRNASMCSRTKGKIILFRQNKRATYNILMISHYTPDAKRYRHVTHNEILKTPNNNNCQWQIVAPLMELVRFWSAADHTGHLIAVPRG